MSYVKQNDNTVINTNEEEYARYKSLRARVKSEKTLSSRIEKLEKEVVALKKIIEELSKK
jgi:uncharacterized protein YceH (UPF0502 family)